VAKLGRNTVSTHLRKAKQFFAEAVDNGVISTNPCRKLRYCRRLETKLVNGLCRQSRR